MRKKSIPAGSKEEHLHDEAVFASFLEYAVRPKHHRSKNPPRDDETDKVDFDFDDSI